MESKREEKKPSNLSSESKPIEGENETSSPSIYAVVAAHSLSKDIKQKSLHLIKVKRRHGDWGQFDMTHAWSPEDFMSNMGSRQSSALARDSSLVDENLTMARPFVMEPLKTFQVCCLLLSVVTWINWFTDSLFSPVKFQYIFLTHVQPTNEIETLIDSSVICRKKSEPILRARIYS